jgi:hypothetical protein
MCLLHSGDSQVIILTTGSSAAYPIKYNKFAYSNTFLMNYDHQNPVDNMLLLKAKGGKWHPRSAVLRNSCRGNVGVSEWQARSLPHVTVKTTLIGRPDGYIVIHQLYKGSRVFFQTGGFPLASHRREIQKRVEQDEVILQGNQDEAAGIRLLYGRAEPFIYGKTGVNPAGKYSFVPCLKGQFDRNGEIAAFAVWASRKKRPMELPSVAVDDKTCQIKWQGEEHTILLGTGE